MSRLRPAITAPQPPGPAALLGLKATVFVPEAASRSKLAHLTRLSAEVIETGADLDEAKVQAVAYADGMGFPFFEDGAEPAQLDGYAAIGEEILDQLNEVPAAVVGPVGNGALGTRQLRRTGLDRRLAASRGDSVARYRVAA